MLIEINAEATKNALKDTFNYELDAPVVDDYFEIWLDYLKRIAEQDGYQIEVEWNRSEWGPTYYVYADDPREWDIGHNWMQNKADFWQWYN